MLAIPIALLIGAVIFFVLLARANRRKSIALKLWQDEYVEQAQRWLAEKSEIAGNPNTELAELRALLAMDNPNDGMFLPRLTVLRILSQNPSLPVELQAAAINRVSQYESAARIDRSLRSQPSQPESSGGVQGFVGFSTDI